MKYNKMLNSIYRFSSVTERFFMELNTRRIDTNAARSETLSIINGMRYLKLGVCFNFRIYSSGEKWDQSGL